ncbi:hypothetical protein PRIPAC_97609 [Pristionchus pacificus]|uniref:G protein-coupled receptor n=1 Tax=Pristionchus pacificus TaxID=54126 RepID=A0A2A6B3E3_PRIPA|nr:hypothetical protein PRIPAC_97609 [Pristionchus pacificus]|eukprot:PDM60394.1 G protein-coupled receptor [Pristionchus pacificus]
MSSSFLLSLEYLEIINAVIGLNFLLLYAIVRFSGSHLGTYKYLLLIFTLSNICLVILHTAVHLRVTAMFVGFQSVPFTLLCIHFLYQFWSHRIVLFSSKSFLFFLAAVVVSGMMTWYLVSCCGGSGELDSAGRRALVDEYERKYGERIENAWIMFDYGRGSELDYTLIVLLVFGLNALMIASLLPATVFAFLTYRHIRRSVRLSPTVKELQTRLLAGMCAQAAIHFIFVYAPYLLLSNLTLLNVNITIFHDATVPLSTFFPVMDAAVIMVLVTDYRRRLVRLMQRKRPGARSMNERK